MEKRFIGVRFIRARQSLTLETAGRPRRGGVYSERARPTPRPTFPTQGRRRPPRPHPLDAENADTAACGAAGDQRHARRAVAPFVNPDDAGFPREIKVYHRPAAGIQRSVGMRRLVTDVSSDELTIDMRVRDPQGELATVQSVLPTGAPSMCRVVLTDGDGYRREVVCSRKQLWKVVSE